MTTWQHWLNLILGLWVVLSAYLDFTPATMVTNLTIVGLAIAVLAVWGALQNQSTYSMTDRTHRRA